MTALNTSSPGVSTRLNHYDHGPVIIITGGIMLGCTAVTLVSKLLNRWPWIESFRLDDVTLLIATTFGIANFAAIAVGVHDGLGQRIDRLSNTQVDHTRNVALPRIATSLQYIFANEQPSGQAVLASFILYFCAEGASAISFAMLLKGLRADRKHGRVMIGLCIIIVLWALAGICRVAASYSSHVAAISQATWIGFAAVNIAIHIALFSSSMWIIWPLQMTTSKKLWCTSWFALCLPIIAVAIVRVIYAPPTLFGNTFTWDDTNFIIITIVEVHLMNINAAYISIPSLLTKVSTGFLAAEPGNTTSKSKSGVGSSYAMHKLTTGKLSDRWRDPIRYGGKENSNITSVRGDAKSIRSYRSDAIMIRRSVELDEERVTQQSQASVNRGGYGEE